MLKLTTDSLGRLNRRRSAAGPVLFVLLLATLFSATLFSTTVFSGPAVAQSRTVTPPISKVSDTHPDSWRADYDRYMQAQLVDRTEAGVASGKNGAVTVAYNGLAARAGFEALKQGGNALDAALTTAVTQVALTAGAPISYFGIMSLVYYDAESKQVYTMNAEWNTLLGETEPMTIPGGIDMSSADGLYGRDPNGRTAMVGGFMKGVGAAHSKFGELSFDQIFAPAIFVADDGMPISKKVAGYWSGRATDLARLPETRKTFLKPDGSAYVEGDVFKQPALAETLRNVARHGTDYMYKGPWAERLVAAVNADGGKMTLEDLSRYEVTWSSALSAPLGEQYTLYTNPPPNSGGVSMIEAQNLARASGMLDEGHWTESSSSFRKALDITQLYVIDFFPEAAQAAMYPGIDFSADSRVTTAHADELWKHLAAGKVAMPWKDAGPKHSDDVVAIDSEGNIAAITHSINCVLWGKTAIVVDGITIGDPASFQQAQIAQIEPGSRLKSPTETGIVFKGDQPVLGFASMGSGLHHRTFQGLLNVFHYGMSVDEAINTPDFFMPGPEPGSLQPVVKVPAGKFPKAVLDGLGIAYEEIAVGGARFAGEGVWVAIWRDPVTGEVTAASHNRTNSAAVAF